MRDYSEDKDINYDWYKLESTILGVREKKSGGFSIRLQNLGNIKSFKLLLKKILDFYKYQFMTFDKRSIRVNDLKNIETELKSMDFGTYQNHNMVFQEKPNLGDTVLIAIKPYIGTYEKGKVVQILTSAKYHPRGYKVMLNDKIGTIGRIATIRKEAHRKNTF
jgi:uncharacterized repeat protein (TIGR03833 family)